VGSSCNASHEHPLRLPGVRKELDQAISDDCPEGHRRDLELGAFVVFGRLGRLPIVLDRGCRLE
jgi:hypothetical protein